MDNESHSLWTRWDKDSMEKTLKKSIDKMKQRVHGQHQTESSWTNWDKIYGLHGIKSCGQNLNPL